MQMSLVYCDLEHFGLQNDLSGEFYFTEFVVIPLFIVSQLLQHGGIWRCCISSFSLCYFNSKVPFAFFVIFFCSLNRSYAGSKVIYSI